jgi:signal transduction histidine kinase
MRSMTSLTTTATANPKAAERGQAVLGRPAALRKAAKRVRSRPQSVRTRIVVWFIGVLAFSTLLSIVVTRAVLDIRLDQRIDSELTQEAAELRKLTTGDDPETGAPFGPNVRRVFEVYLARNVPSRHEALITFIDKKPFLRSAPVLPYRLDRDRALVARWADVRTTDRGRVGTPAGRVDYIAVPLLVGERTAGVFVAAIFRDRVGKEFDVALGAVGAVGLASLLLGSLLAWRLAGRVVGPVAALTRTARSISETDLGRRITVRGDDEVAQLATTFNEMLDRLERAFESQRRFVDDAGHELRTPLTIVRGHLELLDEDRDARQETLALVMDELDRMRRIVDDLLVLAGHDQPDFLSLDTVKVGALTDELFAKVSALASREWVLEHRGRGVIVADRQRLTQAAVQLAQNAVRYSGEGEAIFVGSAVANGEARLWVKDRGAGIPIAEQERIFERFRRGRGEARSEGAGLGLAIVKAIVDAHHGRVELESRAGRGATFTIVIPVDPPEARENP